MVLTIADALLPVLAMLVQFSLAVACRCTGVGLRAVGAEDAVERTP